MLQITPTANTATWATLSVEGLIVAEWVQVLQRECRQRMDSGCSVVLDLDGVSSIDYAGVLMLRALPPVACGDCECIATHQRPSGRWRGMNPNGRVTRSRVQATRATWLTLPLAIAAAVVAVARLGNGTGLDENGNPLGTTVPQAGEPVTFAAYVQPIFTANCALSG